MKFRIITLLLIIVMFSFVTGADADRNPFRPQLPQEKVEVAPVDTSNQTPMEEYPSPDLSILPTPVEEVPIVITPPDLRITGVVWNTDRPQAIINDQVVDVGDTVAVTLANNNRSIDEAVNDAPKIVSITKTSIGIEYQGQQFQLTP